MAKNYVNERFGPYVALGVASRVGTTYLLVRCTICSTETQKQLSFLRTMRRPYCPSCFEKGHTALSSRTPEKYEWALIVEDSLTLHHNRPPLADKLPPWQVFQSHKGKPGVWIRTAPMPTSYEEATKIAQEAAAPPPIVGSATPGREPAWLIPALAWSLYFSVYEEIEALDKESARYKSVIKLLDDIPEDLKAFWSSNADYLVSWSSTPYIEDDKVWLYANLREKEPHAPDDDPLPSPPTQWEL